MPITPAVREDLPRLVGLLGILFSQEAEFRPDPVRQHRGLALILDDPRTGLILVARDGDGLAIGMAVLLCTVSTYLGAPACWLEDVIVHPDHRQAGIGSELLQEAVRAATTRGWARITLLTDAVNADAQRFYARHGFTASPMLPMRRLLG